MKQTNHPNFILGLITLVLLFAGIGLKFYGYSAGNIVLIIGAILGGVHWVWGITDVFKNQNSLSQSRVFWIILVVALPPVGSMFYYMFSKTMRM